MTEKVKITQAQADVIEYLREVEEPFEQFMRGNYENSYAGEFRVLNDTEIDAEVLARALLIGYEIEPEIFYSLDEWVIYGDKIYQIYHIPAIGKVNIKNAIGSVITNVPVQDICHATDKEIKAEQERRLWKKIGRKVGEFRIGDVRILDDGNSVHITDVDYARAKYIQGALKGFYPVESFINFEGGEK